MPSRAVLVEPVDVADGVAEVAARGAGHVDDHPVVAVVLKPVRTLRTDSAVAAPAVLSPLPQPVGQAVAAAGAAAGAATAGTAAVASVAPSSATVAQIVLD